jgi:hypothetical protein
VHASCFKWAAIPVGVTSVTIYVQGMSNTNCCARGSDIGLSFSATHLLCPSFQTENNNLFPLPAILPAVLCLKCPPLEFCKAGSSLLLLAKPKCHLIEGSISCKVMPYQLFIISPCFITSCSQLPYFFLLFLFEYYLLSH